jgi:hypothetical protein
MHTIPAAAPPTAPTAFAAPPGDPRNDCPGTNRGWPACADHAGGGRADPGAGHDGGGRAGPLRSGNPRGNPNLAPRRAVAPTRARSRPCRGT